MLADESLVLDGRFRIVHRLGGGGMGDVYLAEQVSLGRKVALKVLKSEMGLQAGMEKRFKREAQLLASVEHPAVVRVIDFGSHEGSPCLVMEFAEGETLLQALEKGPLPLERALPLLAQLADGLSAIHARGIVHRDLKPENVVLSRSSRGEQARLLDFGIAKLAEPTAESNVSQVGLVLGTPEYLSPEQAVGAPLDARSDLYSFAILVFRTLTGKLPFVGPSPRQFLAQHVAAPPIPIDQASPALARHTALCETVMRCLDKDPASRPASAEVLARVFTSAALELPQERTAQAQAPAPRPEALPFEPPPASTGTGVFGAPAPAPSVQLVPARSTQTLGLGSARPQNLTLMLTDIVGFTARTSRQTREENARMLEEHDQLLLPVFKAHGGRVLQKRGDAFLVAFQSPTESVLCGMVLQDRLWRRNKLVGKKDPLEVRVAIHLGEVLVTRDGPVGEPVQVLAAVEEAAHANEVVFTEAVNLAMIRAEIQAEPRGEVTVRGHQTRLSLYRCRPAAEGPPFGGRDLTQKRASLTARLKERPALIGLTLTAIAAAAALPLALGSTARQVRAQIEAGDAAGALARLQALEPAERASLEPLRIAALHAAGRHRDEWAAAKGLGPERLATLDPLAVSGLAADYANHDDAALRKLLGQLPASRLEALLPSDGWSLTGWGAVRFLDEQKHPQKARLAEGFAASLQSEKCEVRAHAARRLAALGDASAKPALERLAREPKKRDPVLGAVELNCGQDEAAQAVRSLERAATR